MRNFGQSLEAPIAPHATGPVDVNAIAGSVRLVSDDILEVRRYGDSVLRVTLLAVFAVLAAITIVLPWWNGWLDLRMPPVLLDQNAYFGAQFDQAKAVDEFLVTEDRASYIATRLNGPEFWRALIDFTLARVVPLLVFAAFLLWPQAAPLRVDRGRQMIYTKHWGRLLAIPVKSGAVDLDAGLLPALSFQNTTAHGPLIVRLASLDGGTPKRISLGRFPASHPLQNINIHHAIRSFAGQRSIPDWCDTLRGRQDDKPFSPVSDLLTGVGLRIGFSPKDLARLTAWRASF